MGGRDVVGGGPLGFEGMGLAFPFGPGSFGALCRQAGQTAQEDNRVDLAAALGTKTVLPQARDRGHSRSRLRLSEAAFSLPVLESRPLTFITRLRLDAALYEPAPPRRPHQIARPRIKGERLPNLSVVAEDSNTVFGSPSRLLTGTGAGIARSRSLPRRPFGTRQACSPYPYAGSWCAILKESSRPRPYYVPTLRPILRRSSPGL